MIGLYEQRYYKVKHQVQRVAGTFRKVVTVHAIAYCHNVPSMIVRHHWVVLVTQL